VPRSKNGKARSGLPFLILVLAFALVLGLWRQAGFDPASGGLENALLDLRFRMRGPAPPPPDVAILAIDEETLSRIGTMAPLRSALADAIERLSAAGPAAIAINLLLLNRTGADTRLAAALAATDRALLAVATTQATEPDLEPLHPEVAEALARSRFPVVAEIGTPRTKDISVHRLLPHPGLAAAAGLAHVNIVRADDRVARQLPLALHLGIDDLLLPALPLAAARLYPGLREMLLWPGERVILGRQTIPMTPSGRVTLDHYGPAGTIATFGLTDLLDGALDPRIFAGSIVFIGATAESLGDLYATPFASDVPGVEILATLAANIVEGRSIRRDTTAALWTLFLSVILAGLAWRSARLRSPFLAVATTVALWLAAAILVQLAFSPGQLWLDATTIFGALLFASALSGGARYLTDIRSTDRLSRERERLSYFLSPIVAESLAGGEGGSLDGQTRTAAILFVDLAGYTTMAETMAPADVSRLLVRLHAHIDRAVSGHGGVIVEFLGDGALAAFGLQGPAPSDAAEAIACGTLLLDQAAPGYPVQGDGRPLQLRVSIHHGPIGIAVVGGHAHGHLTITGDTVNVASRLQEVAKEHECDFVATREAIEAARAHGLAKPIPFAPLTRITMRGRQQPTEVWASRPAADRTGEVS